MPSGHLSKRLLEICAGAGDVTDHVAVDQLLEEHQRRAAGEQVAAVGAAVVAERCRRGDSLTELRRPDRHAGAERLAERHQVRLQAKRRRVERAARSAEAGLDLVGNQQRAGAGAGPRNRVRHRLRERPDAAFALQRLRDDRRGGRSDRAQRARRDRRSGTH